MCNKGFFSHESYGQEAHHTMRGMHCLWHLLKGFNDYAITQGSWSQEFRMNLNFTYFFNRRTRLIGEEMFPTRRRTSSRRLLRPRRAAAGNQSTWREQRPRNEEGFLRSPNLFLSLTLLSEKFTIQAFIEPTSRLDSVYTSWPFSAWALLHKVQVTRGPCS